MQRGRPDNHPAGVEGPVIDHQKDNAGGHSGREDRHVDCGGHAPAGMNRPDSKQDQLVEHDDNDPLGWGDCRLTQKDPVPPRLQHLLDRCHGAGLSDPLSRLLRDEQQQSRERIR